MRELNEDKELDMANSQPLSQVAARWLRVAKESPDPEQLYPIQLMRWGLGQGLREWNRDQRALLRHTVELLASRQNPLDLLRYLTANPAAPESPLLTPEELQVSNSPRQVAVRLLQCLEDRLRCDPDMRGDSLRSPSRINN